MSLLDERRRQGLDVFDEMWDGILHMVPAPAERHQRFGADLLIALAPIVRSRGLIQSYENALYKSGAGEDDYRIPDLIVTSPESRTRRGSRVE